MNKNNAYSFYFFYEKFEINIQNYNNIFYLQINIKNNINTNFSTKN